MSIDFAFLLDTLRQLLAAVPTTLGLFFASLVLGGLLSLVIVTMRVSPHWLPNRFARVGAEYTIHGSDVIAACFQLGLQGFHLIECQRIHRLASLKRRCACKLCRQIRGR